MKPNADQQHALEQEQLVEETYAAVEEVLNAEDDPGLDGYQQFIR